MSKLTLALVGNPNTGKSTLFNALTGSKQRVGNWPGVTVEKRTGVFEASGVTVEVVDLPGIYALPESDGSGVPASEDEQIACRYLLSGQMSSVINVLDAMHPERSLYLTVQLLEQGIPVVVVANRMDLAKKQGVQLDCAALSKALGCPVLPLIARQRKGVSELKQHIVDRPQRPVSPEAFKKQVFGGVRTDLPMSSECDIDILRADARYQFIQEIVQKCLRQVSHGRSVSRAIDRVVLNRFLGIPIFFGVMYALFFFALGLGGIFQDFFDLASGTVFVGGTAQVLGSLGVPSAVIALLSEGVGRGIQTTLTFVPVLSAMFFFLAMLEDSGYMARAAFVVDRLMRMLGLPGKALVPVIVGFGCNVPAVMAARTLESERDRILTVMMMPFVPCGARLAIFAVFVAAFFPKNGANVVFCLYLTGIVAAILTGFLIRKTVLTGEPAPLVMEMPEWLLPDPRTLLVHTSQRLRGFVIRAGRLIVPISMLIGALNVLPVGDPNHGTTMLAVLGRFVTPLFSPMGIDGDNWPATVGLMTGVLAKEVVIGSLNTLYSQSAHLVTAAASFDFWAGLREAFASISANVSALCEFFSHPVAAVAPIQALPQSVYGVMAERFHGTVGAFAYLLFVLLYFPCVSTLAVMWREVGRRWTLFSMGWSIGVAYSAAVLFYQMTILPEQPMLSLGWLGGVGLAGIGMVVWIRRFARGMLA